MSEIEIRPAGLSEIPAIQLIARETWPETFREILSPEQIEYMLGWMYASDVLADQMQHKGHHFILAFCDGFPVGFCGYEPHFAGTPITRIHKIYLLPRMQGKGVGIALMKYVRSQALQVGDRTLNLNVNRFNKAVGFYQKIGFSIVREENIDIGRGYLMEDYVMECSI